LFHTLANNAARVVEVHETDARMGQAKPIAVAAGQRGAGQDRIAAAGSRIP
jgi:hypothetical protein